MEEVNIALCDPEETVLDVEPEAIDADWNSAPDDKLEDRNDAPEDGGEDADGTDGVGSDQSFTLKHLSEVRTVGRDEVITLAQKGLDYDRIRGKYDALSAELRNSGDAYGLLKEMAEAQGMTAEALIDATRAQLLAQKHGITPQAAVERVRSMHDTRDKSAQTDASTRKRQEEIREFLGEYGTGIDPRSIPSEVWQSVAGGKTLLAAYQAWELQKLRAESRAALKNAQNKERSAGSRFSAAGVKPRDAIADDWYDN